MNYDDRVAAVIELAAEPGTLEDYLDDAADMVSLVSMPAHTGPPIDVPDEEDADTDLDPRLAAEFDESKHPRVPAGHPNGGQWTDNGSDFLEAVGTPSKEYPYEDEKLQGTGENLLTNIQDEVENDFMERVFGGNGDAYTGSAPTLKRDVERLLGPHLEKQFTRDELEQMANLLGIPSSILRPDPKDSGRIDEDFPTSEIANAVAGTLVKQWAMSSGDTHAFSVLMQDAIKQEFGLDDSVFDHLADGKGVAKAWEQLLLHPGPADDPYEPERANNRSLITRVMRAHARAQYVETQRALSEAGIDHVDLVRGAGLHRDHIFDIARTGQAVLQPASSFSLNFSTAQAFSGVGYGKPDSGSTVIRTRVPRSRILSFPKTGFGCLNEREVVVLGGKIKTRIMYWL